MNNVTLLTSLGIVLHTNLKYRLEKLFFTCVLNYLLPAVCITLWNSWKIFVEVDFFFIKSTRFRKYLLDIVIIRIFISFVRSVLV